MGHDQRQRVLMPRLHVDEMDVHPVDLGRELPQRVQPRLARPPVVLGRPKTGERLRSPTAHPATDRQPTPSTANAPPPTRRRNSASCSSGTSIWNGRTSVVVTDKTALLLFVDGVLGASHRARRRCKTRRRCCEGGPSHPASRAGAGRSRSIDHRADGEELGLPVLERVLPEVGAADVLQPAHGSLVARARAARRCRRASPLRDCANQEPSQINVSRWTQRVRVHARAHAPGLRPSWRAIARVGADLLVPRPTRRPACPAPSTRATLVARARPSPGCRA